MRLRKSTPPTVTAPVEPVDKTYVNMSVVADAAGGFRVYARPGTMQAAQKLPLFKGSSYVLEYAVTFEEAEKAVIRITALAEQQYKGWQTREIQAQALNERLK